jgi:manganese/zinc/iron transport system permease protein
VSLAEFLQLDLGPLLLVTLAGVACALPGNFLLLKRASLVGDTIAHAVLPGIVIVFILTGAVATIPTMLGAMGAALAAVLCVDLVARAARIEQGAAMALVFTSFFALGVVLLETSGARSVHVDTEHALMGAVENAIWLAANGPASLFDPAALASFPPSVQRVAAVAALAAAVVLVAFKELRVASFDPGFAAVAGLRPRLADAILLVLAAAAAVAAFEAVGAILTIALFVCPPATARLLTDRLEP